MKKLFKVLVILLLLLTSICIIKNPSEDDFMHQIVMDYSLSHPEFELTKSDLIKMGTTKYSSYLIFSTFSYRFGDIEVYYWGILGSIYSNGFKENLQQKQNNKTVVV